MDIDPVVVAELNLDWVRDALIDMRNELYDWAKDNDMEDEEYVADIRSSISDAVSKTDGSLREITGQLKEMCKTSKRLFDCRERNAWEIKPCWNVYTKLKQEALDISYEPIENDLSSLKRQFNRLKKDVQIIREEMCEVDDYLDLSKKDRDWFLKLADNLYRVASLSEKPLCEGANSLYLVYIRALEYCNCQKNTGQEQCLSELDALRKAVAECSIHNNSK